MPNENVGATPVDVTDGALPNKKGDAPDADPPPVVPNTNAEDVAGAAA